MLASHHSTSLTFPEHALKTCIACRTGGFFELLQFCELNSALYPMVFVLCIVSNHEQIASRYFRPRGRFHYRRHRSKKEELLFRHVQYFVIYTSTETASVSFRLLVGTNNNGIPPGCTTYSQRSTSMNMPMFGVYSRYNPIYTTA
jgi:hypothetical protein